MSAIDARLDETLNFCRSYMALNGVAPKLIEIAEHLKTTKGNIHRYLTALEYRGDIARHKRRRRSLTILNTASPAALRTSGDTPGDVPRPPLASVAGGPNSERQGA